MKSWGYVAALIVGLCLFIWHQQSRIEAAEAAQGLAIERAERAQETADRHASNATTLAATLDQERTAQSILRTQTNALRTQLAARQRDIEELKHENQELRDWADQPLPDAARRLRERPALTGADAYRDWLSRSRALHSTGDSPRE